MWGVGVLFFIFTFLEEHAWLLPDVFAAPIVDLRVQWKATGTLVGSFNLFVYGILYYVAEKLSGDERYAHSNLRRSKTSQRSCGAQPTHLRKRGHFLNHGHGPKCLATAATSWPLTIPSPLTSSGQPSHGPAVPRCQRPIP